VTVAKNARANVAVVKARNANVDPTAHAVADVKNN